MVESGESVNPTQSNILQKFSPVAKEEKFSKIRANLIGDYKNNLTALTSALEKNPSQMPVEHSEFPDKRPLVTVVTSLWEETSDMTTMKMFERSIADLVKQAKESGFNLDFIIVANNGGGKTAELGEQLRAKLVEFLKVQKDQLNISNTTAINTKQPAGVFNSSTPWDLTLPLVSKFTRSDGNRIILVDQPFTDSNGANAGKIRAVRDVVHALKKSMSDDNYRPDAIFQTDAETILEYSDEKFKGSIPPLKALFNNLKRRKLVAIGTKDRFKVIDSETGSPADVPVGGAQVGFMLTNTRDRLVSLSGGHY
ncbi:hypothetical protein A2774_00520 [Candidatus Roizmanbacteria bacterium RIFCSPHIGHO2_01_FULL_39_12c]|uniref:Uncharacterized protein n=1 Tax=Candidatus Roizmanbacteria bacterium RIFCSPHIGHO2_01_FULL_39_12c TaxID=1802031 RepID=A0A1F7G9X6_9BACT|nr:MAG: hypothetical protein A2774_00520 [Candidatus Roizmanbacteria bacterium RIFCSPHIGHO2_01_FULL_39_12c]OGK46214.1 MAG: hypothetical protein A2963_01980 [Candidatus Roizmanbacteria bacterium RIFCSPLOWO2_01_FULL_40_13]